MITYQAPFANQTDFKGQKDKHNRKGQNIQGKNQNKINQRDPENRQKPV
jgi:hypothetical protein